MTSKSQQKWIPVFIGGSQEVIIQLSVCLWMSDSRTHFITNTLTIISVLQGFSVERLKVCWCVVVWAPHQQHCCGAWLRPWCEVGILSSRCWQRRPHNSPPVEAPGAAVLSESVAASLALQTRFSFSLSLMWKRLQGATAAG